MFGSFRRAEREALDPLLEIARCKQGADRTEFLDDLRLDAPTVVARLERLLADGAAGASAVPLDHAAAKRAGAHDAMQARRELPTSRAADTLADRAARPAASARPIRLTSA